MGVSEVVSEVAEGWKRARRAPWVRLGRLGRERCDPGRVGGRAQLWSAAILKMGELSIGVNTRVV